MTLIPIIGAAGMLAQPTGPGLVTRGLGAYYKMDEGTGNAINDSSNNGYDGATTADAQWVAEGLSFDGTYRIEAPVIQDEVVGTDAFTALIVQKQTTAQAALANGTIGLAASSFAISGYLAYMNGLYFDWDGSASRANGATPQGYNDAWHVIALHVDGATSTLFCDSTQVGQNTGVGHWVPAHTQKTLYMGYEAILNTFFNGKLASVLLYKVALTSPELSQMRAYLKSALAPRGVVLP